MKKKGYFLLSLLVLKKLRFLFSLQILEAKKIYDYHPKKLNELNLKRQELHEERAKHSKKKKCCGK